MWDKAGDHPPYKREVRGGEGDFGAKVRRAILMEGRFPTRRPKKKKRHMIQETPPKPRRRMDRSHKDIRGNEGTAEGQVRWHPT